MKHASLFSGIGGFDLAASWMGWENILQCEIDPFCQKVLHHHFPSTTLYGDIRQLDGTKYRGSIDILTGGFPCQPFSAAGKRKGTEDNRFLWPEMLRVIREIQPTWVIAENVRGITSIENGLVFERVCSEMEEAQYEVQPFCIPACSVGAPHKRERIWFIAHAKSIGTRGGSGEVCGKDGGQNDEGLPEPLDTNTGSSTNGAHEQRERRKRGRSSSGESKTSTGNGDSNAANAKRELWSERRASESERPSGEPRGCHWEEPWSQAATRLCKLDDGIPRELDGITFSKWRNESIKAYGNAIIPQIAYQLFQSIPL